MLQMLIYEPLEYRSHIPLLLRVCRFHSNRWQPKIGTIATCNKFKLLSLLEGLLGQYRWRLTVFYVITPTLCRRLEFYIRWCSYWIANLHRGSKVQVQEQEIIKCLIFGIETVTVIWRHFVAPLALPSSLVCDAPINLCELLLLGGANSISNLKYIQGELVWGYLRLESSGLLFWLILNLEKLFSANLSIMEEKS